MKIIIKDLQEIFTNAKTDLNKKLDHPTGRGTALSNWFDIDEEYICHVIIKRQKMNMMD